MTHRSLQQVLLLLGLMVVFATSMVFADESGSVNIIFVDDFSDDKIGGTPSQWSLANAGGVYGDVAVIDAPDMTSGKAVRVVVNPHEDSKNVSMRGPAFDPPEDHTTVIIDHWIRWVEGGAMYSYVVKSTNRLLWYVRSPGELVYQGENGVESVPVNEGWNHIRLVADRLNNEVYVFVNDMDTAVMGPHSFLRPMDDWKDAQLVFSHWTHANDRREIHYGDFKVWSVESMEDIGLIESSNGEDEPDQPIAADPEQAKNWLGRLRPTERMKEAHAEHAASIPFYQTLPIAQGALHPSHLGLASNGLRHVATGEIIPAELSPAVLWPDGTVRWLAVEGVWPGHIPFSESSGEAVGLVIDETTPGEVTNPIVHSLEVRDNKVHLLDDQGQLIAALTPHASYIEITEPKEILPDSLPDDERQYAWAEPLEALNPGGSPKPLSLRIREHIVEQDNDLFTLYRLRGDGGATLPGSGLEWQLRVRVYKASPVVRLQMTWAFHWDPEKYALTKAEWAADFASPLVEAMVPGLDCSLHLAAGSVRKQSEPSGRHSAVYQDRCIVNEEWPDPKWDFAVVKMGDPKQTAPFVGVGVPRFTRLGPNSMTFHEGGIVLASWSEHSGMGLDLRVTAEEDEFGIASGDITTNGMGVMQTLESTLIWGESEEEAKAVARLEAYRDTLWLPGRDDLIESGSLGPWAPHVFDSNAAYFEDVGAHIHFILASRDHWRWNGWANYGDIRTNFSRSSNPDRGLHPDRWALYGRYGWRKASAQPYLGMWIHALATEDRDMAMFALDYALHVSDIDIIHGSFFRPRSSQTGGAHRRNKDHWSGSAQMQYTFNTGLYLSRWLTGHERLGDTLAEVREYARGQGSSSSAMAGVAWVHRYAETHDPEALALARKLLDESAIGWERRGIGVGPPQDRWGNPDPNVKLTGLAALYQNNFRLPLDGIPSLIEFHKATGDPEYLEAILTTTRVHGLPDGLNASLSNYYGIAYLLLNGYTVEDIGADIVQTAENHVSQLIARANVPYPPRSEWNYETLLPAALRGGSMETTGMGWRGAQAPIVLSAFGQPPVRVHFHTPRDGQRVSGDLPVHFELADPDQLSELEHVTVELNNHVIYSGSGLPSQEDLAIDTMSLDDGRHTLIVTMSHREFGTIRHTAGFSVANRWNLVQNMTPPVTQGWFGTIDLLQTDTRSDGWTYDTSDRTLFFGDAERLVRATQSTEYLIWKTPQLRSVSITSYIQPGIDLSQGFEVAVSTSGEDWHAVSYEPKVDGEASDAWHRAVINLDFDGDPEYEYFRITMNESLSKEAVQIGEIVFSGIRQEDDK